MKVIGLNAYHGDSSACLVDNGKVICAFEEERLVRKKHWAGFPLKSIKACLSYVKCDISDIDKIVYSKDPNAKKKEKIKYLFKSFRTIDLIINRFKFFNKLSNVKKIIKIEFPNFKGEIEGVEHHLSHAASAVFSSGFNRCNIISIDALGDFTSTRLYNWTKNNGYHEVSETTFPNSIGFFYTAFTQFLGFPYFGDEYKLMGLSPYRSPKFEKLISSMIWITNDGKVEMNQSFFTHQYKGVKTNIHKNNDPTPSFICKIPEFEKFLGIKARNKNDDFTQEHKDLASSVQKVCENLITQLATFLYNKHNEKNLVIVGGVGQNSVFNGKVLSLTKYENLFVPPAAHDSGTAIGSALQASYENGLNVFRKYSPYLGGSYELSKNLINKLNKNFNVIIFDDNNKLIDKTIDKLLKGNKLVSR